jgi:CheY-like chemotaxis protein
MTKNLFAFLIDDDPDDHDFFAIAMQEHFPAINFAFAHDGIFALNKLNADPDFIPDIIFLDINMPRMNGMECLLELKKIPRLNRTYIYMYSTSAEPAIIDHCLSSGADGYLKKQTSSEALKEKILEILSKINIASS